MRGSLASAAASARRASSILASGVELVRRRDPRDRGRARRSMSVAGLGQAGVRILGGDAGQRGGLVHDPLERGAREVGGGGRRRGPAREHAQRQPLLAGVRDGVDLAQAHRGAEVPLLDQEPVGGGGATRSAARRARRRAARRIVAAHTWVPPTVMPSMRMVGSPTPTGTDCPSLPQVPTPSSSGRSRPTRLTRVSASGPLPISVAPFTGARDPAVLDQVGLAGREDELAAGDVDLAAAEGHGVEAAVAPSG